jgi:MYXO-CTERM domain-containing protein
MSLRKGVLFFGAVLCLTLPSMSARAHWCDDLWASSYNIVVRPETDTVTAGAPMNIYVQNNMGYQLINFKLIASVGGTALTVTAPSTLKVSGTLLPGEKGLWKISGSGLTKIEDVSFSVSFGNGGQSNCYPTKSAKAVMVVKTDGSLFPAPPALPGLDNASNPGSGCVGDMSQGRSLQYEAIADFEDANAGLDKLLQLYCAGRGSWGSSDGVTPSNCPDTATTNCPSSKPTSGSGTKYSYMHLWAAGELAARKAALGARAPVLRARLQCGVNDADVGFAGYALFMLGYMGEDAGARTFIESQIASGSGDMQGIAKASLLLMKNAADMTKYQSDVQAGLKSSSTFMATASAAALGIAAKDDKAVSDTLIPLVKWIQPDTSDDGKGLFAGHLLALVAWDRRQWEPNGADKGPVTFYGDTAVPTGGASGRGGAQGSGGVSGSSGAGGNRDGGAGTQPGSGGVVGSGGRVGPGRGGASGSGGVAGTSGAPGAGGGTSVANPTGGALGTGGLAIGGAQSSGGEPGLPGGASGNVSGGATGTPAGTGGSTGGATTDGGGSNGCKCNLAGRPDSGSTPSWLMLLGLAALVLRRRR